MSQAPTKQDHYNSLQNLPYSFYPEFKNSELPSVKDASEGEPQKISTPKALKIFSKKTAHWVFPLLMLLGCALIFKSNSNNGGATSVFNMIIFVLMFGFFAAMQWIATALSLSRTTLKLTLGAAIAVIFLYFNPFASLIPFLGFLFFFGGSIYCRAKYGAPVANSFNASPNFSRGLSPASYSSSLVNVWGEAGKHISNASDFGAAAEYGNKGEIIVGKALNNLQAKYPFIRVFHSVKFVPNSSKNWDIDHVVIIGNDVYFVDAKYWYSTSYSWASDGVTVLKEGSVFNGGDVHMNNAVNEWLPLLNGVANTVKARICLAKPEERYHYKIDNRGARTVMLLTTTQNLIQELESAAVNCQPVVNRYLVKLISDQLFH